MATWEFIRSTEGARCELRRSRNGALGSG